MISIMDERDEKWRDLAVAGRDALRLLGYDIEPACLPDEAAPCGGTFYQHSIAHMATLAAMAEHHRRHLHSPIMQASYQEIYEHELIELDKRCEDPAPYDLLF